MPFNSEIDAKVARACGFKETEETPHGCIVIIEEGDTWEDFYPMGNVADAMLAAEWSGLFNKGFILMKNSHDEYVVGRLDGGILAGTIAVNGDLRTCLCDAILWTRDIPKLPADQATG